MTVTPISKSSPYISADFLKRTNYICALRTHQILVRVLQRERDLILVDEDIDDRPDMPPSLIRITASNSSKHTPKSILKHQLFKSTGILPKRLLQDSSKKKHTLKTILRSVQNEYIITGYNDLDLYPDFNISLDNEDEDEIIEDDESQTMSDENGVIKGLKFLLNHRFDPNIPPVAKGVITKSFKAKILEKRNLYPPIIIKNQLYSLFINQITKVDKEIENLITDGKLMKLLINHIQFNDNLIVMKKDYIKILDIKLLDNVDENHQDDDDDDDYRSLTNFKKLILENNGISVVSEGDLANYKIKTSILVNHGFLNYSQDHNDYYISLPNLGNYLNFLKQASLFINYLIQRSKSKQILEKDLIDKWGVNYHNWYKFYGLDLKFILSLNYGMGFIENFNTTVGNGWKLA